MMPFQDPPRGSDPVRVTPQFIVGALVIVVGVLFLLDELGIVRAAQYVRYWPVALIAIGLVKLWQSRDGYGGAFAGLIFSSAGVWLLLEELAVVRISFFDLWPLLLVFFGGYLVWHGASQSPRAPAERAPVPAAPPDLPPEPSFEEPPQAPQATPPIPRQTLRPHGPSDRFTAVAVLGAIVRGSHSQAFRKADLLAIMGGCEIDLRRAAIHGEAVIDLFTLWGGIEIRVPDDWSVDSEVVPLMGGVEDKTRPPKSATPHRLVLRGVALMGGVEIKN
jgi:hypothetical protein